MVRVPRETVSRTCAPVAMSREAAGSAQAVVRSVIPSSRARNRAVVRAALPEGDRVNSPRQEAS
jgi:hypothetical protein